MTKSATAQALRSFIEKLDHTVESGAAPAVELSLTLALAATAFDDWTARGGRMRPLQVAVIGPTQVGKSTVVNVLLGAAQAEASPLAAFTDRLYGFAATATEQKWVHQVLGDATAALERSQQSREVESIVWDTPDFDSHRSYQYRSLIARVSALADVLVLVVSKEKYSDMSVWTTLDLLRPLGRRLVVCLNKVSVDNQLLIEAVNTRLQQSAWKDMQVPIVVLPYVGSDNAFEALSGCKAADQLSRCVFSLEPLSEDERRRGIQSMIKVYWDRWLDPVRVEVSALDQWRSLLDKYLQSAFHGYREQYLDNADHNDAFDQVVLRLLQLLEIPGIAGPLSSFRKVLTWPVRKVISAMGQDSGPTKEISEALVLEDIVDHALLSLRRVCSEVDPGSTQAKLWWHELNRGFDAAAVDIREQFRPAVDRYQLSFAPEIEQAAHSLYQRLQENPAVLNSLRATRIGADVAAVVVAINTGTVGLSEAILTPALLSMTSALTEGAVGKYVDSVRNQLKDKQGLLVQDLLHQQLGVPLLRLPQDLANSALFHIDREELEQIERAREEFMV